MITLLIVVTQAERDQIQKQRFNDDLPDGWFYDGHRYVSHEHQSSTHPHLEKFVEELVNKENERIRSYNQAVRMDLSSQNHK